MTPVFLRDRGFDARDEVHDADKQYVVLMIEAEYGVDLSDDQVEQARTVQDLLNLVPK